MIKEVTYYDIICDRCGKSLTKESEMCYTDTESAEMVAIDTEWKKIGGKHYCADCSKQTAYCGECPLLRYEDTDGFGICHVSSREQRCSDTCHFLSAPPTHRQAAKLLHYAQKWRRGKKCAMLPPAILGVAIDTAIRTMRKSKISNQV